MQRFHKQLFSVAAMASLAMPLMPQSTASDNLSRLTFRQPDLLVDLGVGLWAWPLPMDYDGDADNDLIVVCPDVPYAGTYFFENLDGQKLSPKFAPPRRLDRAIRNAQVSYTGDRVRVLGPNVEYVDFRDHHFSISRDLGLRGNLHGGRVRANQWKYFDYDADGQLDLIVGVGDWEQYGWDNAFDNLGRWSNGPLHGYVYLLRNTGNNLQPQYGAPVRLQAGGSDIDVFGMPSPNLADFDGDGDADLICGEFLDGFSYFENVGSRQAPQFAEPRRLEFHGQAVRMDLQMITPTAIDWDGDHDFDLVVGDEDGRVALVEHTGQVVDGIPEFRLPQYFRQLADEVKFGALVTPYSHDWDGDGDEDLICGNTAGYLGFIENLGDNPPRWAAPIRLQAGGRTIRIQAGANGSIQGPCEAKWGYTAPSVGDWDDDGLPDIIVNSIWGKVVWFRNVGTRQLPQLEEARPILVEWQGPTPKPAWNWWSPWRNELVTQWRTTPVVVDWNADGLLDLVMLDHEGYLALFERRRVGSELRLSPPKRVFYGRSQHTYDSRHTGTADGDGPLQLNNGVGGRSGRRKLAVVDWDRDGRLDILVNSRSVHFLRNIETDDDGRVWLQDEGPLIEQRLAGHTTSPTTVDFDGDGQRELLVGAEDGRLYYLPR